MHSEHPSEVYMVNKENFRYWKPFSFHFLEVHIQTSELPVLSSLSRSMYSQTNMKRDYCLFSRRNICLFEVTFNVIVSNFSVIYGHFPVLNTVSQMNPRDRVEQGEIL